MFIDDHFQGAAKLILDEWNRTNAIKSHNLENLTSIRAVFCSLHNIFLLAVKRGNIKQNLDRSESINVNIFHLRFSSKSSSIKHFVSLPLLRKVHNIIMICSLTKIIDTNELINKTIF